MSRLLVKFLIASSTVNPLPVAIKQQRIVCLLFKRHPWADAVEGCFGLRLIATALTWAYSVRGWIDIHDARESCVPSLRTA